MDMEALFGHLEKQQDIEAGDLNRSSNFSWLSTDFLERNPVLTTSYLTVLTIFMVAGSIGNIMVIGAVLVSRRLRTTGNIFIVNLAIADFFLTAFIDPFSIVGVVKGPIFFVDKKALCYVIAGFCLPSCICSLWTMGAIAINRYIFLCHHYSYKRIYTRRKTILMCLALWVTGYMTMEFPAQMKWVSHTFDMKKMMCSYNRVANYPHIVFFVSFAILVPLVVVSGFYLKIFLYVLSTQNELQLLSQKDREHNRRNENQSRNRSTYMDRVLMARKREAIALAKTLFLVFLVFFVCWTPYALVILIDHNDNWSRVVYVVVIQLGHTNASVNSIIYASSNRHFRRGYVQFLTMCCPKYMKRVLQYRLTESRNQYRLTESRDLYKKDSFTDLSHSLYNPKQPGHIVYNITFKPDKSES